MRRAQAGECRYSEADGVLVVSEQDGEGDPAPGRPGRQNDSENSSVSPIMPPDKECEQARYGGRGKTASITSTAVKGVRWRRERSKPPNHPAGRNTAHCCGFSFQAVS